MTEKVVMNAIVVMEQAAGTERLKREEREIRTRSASERLSGHAELIGYFARIRGD